MVLDGYIRLDMIPDITAHACEYTMFYGEFRDLPDGAEFVMERAFCGREYRAIKVGSSVQPVDGVELIKKEHREHQFWAIPEFIETSANYVTKCPECAQHPDLALRYLGELP